MKLSIITVVRHDFKGIQRTYFSIASFIENGAQWIVIDGGSDDETKNFIKTIQNKNIIYKRGNDSGIYDAMNKGMELAKINNYLWFLNAGDINKVCLKKATHVLQNSKKSKINCIKFDVLVNKSERHENITLNFLIFNSPNHQSLWIKKKIHTKFSTKCKLASDYGVFLHLFCTNQIFIKYVKVPAIDYDLSGVTAKPESKNLIRKERLEISRTIFFNTRSYKALIIYIIQSIIYTVYFIFPSLNIKRHKD